MELLNKVLHNPFVLVGLSASIVFVVMFLDSKISRTNREKSTYYKNVGLASSLVAFSLFSSKFNYAKLASKSVGGGGEQMKKEEVKVSNDTYEFSNEKFDD